MRTWPLLILLLSGCDSGRAAESGDTADTDLPDVADSDSERDTGAEGEVPSRDVSLPCYDYRLFSFIRWGPYPKGTAFSVNDDELVAVHGSGLLALPNDGDGLFTMTHFDRISQRGEVILYKPEGLAPGMTQNDPTDPVLYDPVPVAINNAGTILARGHYELSSLSRAAVWRSDLVIQLLSPDPGEMESHPQALNDAGSIVGYYYETYLDEAIPAVVTHSVGFLWQDTGGAPTLMVPLPGAPADGRIEPYGINNLEQICGAGKDAADSWQPFVWESGSYTLLETLAGGEGIARDISDTGLVVGESLDAEGVWRPVLWDATGIHDLGLLDTEPMRSGTARSVNSAGTVIGWDDPVDFNSHTQAWIWRDGVKTALDNLFNPHTSHHLTEVHDINESGTIVGAAVSYHGLSVFDYREPLSVHLFPLAVALVPQDCPAASN